MNLPNMNKTTTAALAEARYLAAYAIAKLNTLPTNIKGTK